jgi:TonB family protein
MLCFLKRILPFTLTLIVGLAIGGLFNLFNAKTPTGTGVLRLQTSYASGGGGYGEGSGCRSRRRSGETSSSSYDLASRYSSAQILSQPLPKYTDEARRNQTEGQVTLRITLAADGTVSNVEPLTTLPYGLTDQAEKAARKIKFIPAKYNGSAIEELKTITYSFDLN